MYRILAIDDDPIFLGSLTKLLKYQNYTVEATSNPFQALDLLKEKEYHCVLLDVQMPGRDGMSLLQKIKEEHASLPIIMISGKSTLMVGMNAIKEGAFDFLEKGGDLDRLLISLKNAIRYKEMLSEREALFRTLHAELKLCAKSPAMQRVLQQINDFTLAEGPVLISGESGTGKEMVAQLLHLKSTRASGPFVKINCACCSPESQIEAALGNPARKNTNGNKDNALQSAHGGTLFLNEISALSPGLQESVVRYFHTNGDSQRDVWLIAASNQNLDRLAATNRFNKTLLQLLQERHIRLPTLNERKEDIPELTDYFVGEFAAMYNKPVQGTTEQAMKILQETSWPENVRMLKKVVEKAVIFAQKGTITPKEIELSLALYRHFESTLSSHQNVEGLLDALGKQRVASV